MSTTNNEDENKLKNPWGFGPNGNPEDEAKFDKKIDEFIKGENNSFNWFLEDDIAQGAVDINNVKYINARYSIPNQIIGNPETANLFICLYNPRTDEEADNQTNLKDFQQIISGKLINQEFFSVNTNNYFDVENFSSKTDEEKKVIVRETYKKHVINVEENILYQELRKIICVLKREELKDDNIFNPDFDKSKKENYNNFYYLNNYYAALFSKAGMQEKCTQYRVPFEKIEAKIFPNGKLDEEAANKLLEQFKALDICNLEINPYRSKNKKNFSFGHISAKTSEYSARLIVQRIINHKKNNETSQLRFILRSKAEWSECINKVLPDYQNELQDLFPKNLKKEENYQFDDFLEYFCGLGSRNGTLSLKNLRILDTSSKNAVQDKNDQTIYRLSAPAYSDIQEKFLAIFSEESNSGKVEKGKE